MLDEVERRNQQSASIVGDLLARAGTPQASEGEAPVAVQGAPRASEDGDRAAEPTA
jgi:hypothetical protein